VNESDSSAHSPGLWSPYASHMECDTADSAASPLRDSLQRAVFFDLYQLQDWIVHDRCDTDMNALLWSQILACDANGGDWDELKMKGILVCGVDDIPSNDSAFITHRWNGIQGVAAMSLSFFQCFVYHMCTQSGYQPQVRYITHNYSYWRRT
jgi:hypothetical protein